MKKEMFSIVIIFTLFLMLDSVVILGYKVESGMEVHQYIAKDAGRVWPLISNDTGNHLKTAVNQDLDGIDFQNGEDIITGSGEEDTDFIPSFPFKNHFWNPDDPQGGRYNDGLQVFGANVDSSYTKAKELWIDKVIPNYIKGNLNESYYWLGRVAHLLEDAAQPGHVLLDCHMDREIGKFICQASNGDGGADDSVLEEYTGINFPVLRSTQNWTGSNFKGQQYNYENLPNLSGFNWDEVEPTSAIDQQNIELFRLFWYTAQKTQYFSSDDVDGNNVYFTVDGAQRTFSTDLWSGHNVRMINRSIYLAADDVTDSGNNVSAESNAMIPHAMRAVAGLYRLFDDAVRIDWPTENHDFRRTGFTLLKGDMERSSDVDRINFVINDGVNLKLQALKSIVADIDGNGAMETVTFVHDTSAATRTDIYAVETTREDNSYGTGKKVKTEKKWIQRVEGSEGAIIFPGTLANIDSDSRKELITGIENGTVYVYDIGSNGKTVTERWRYHLVQKWSPLATTSVTRFNGGTAVVDIDLDGTNEIIFADVFETDPNWPGEVYVLKDNGAGVQPTKFANYTFYDAGAYATVSVANVDNDDNPEIIVPGVYGIHVFDYDTSAPNDLTLKWSNTHGKIESSAVIADVDKDNQYELVYTTSTNSCASGQTCYNRTYVVNASSGTIETQINLTTLPRPTPAVANLDSDSNMEIVLIRHDDSSASQGSVEGDVDCYDAVTGIQCSGWPFNDGGSLMPPYTSPNIADIDNDGNYNIIFAENNGSRVFVLDNDGSELFHYTFDGFADNGIAIADIDQDGVAELTLKKHGSPLELVSVSSKNKQPSLEPVMNITALVGDLINITEKAQLSGSDPNNNVINFSYSAPFNSTALWQTNVNDTGNYTILVEVSDGNLTDYRYVELTIFNNNTRVVNNLTDGSTAKSLEYAAAGNQTVRVRLPKNARVLYSKITLEGTAR